MRHIPLHQRTRPGPSAYGVARARARAHARTHVHTRARAHARTRAYARTRARTYAAILKGKYPFSLPPERAVYLTSVRDMGRLAGACLAGEPPPAAGGRTLNVASELTSPAGMAAAFAEAQGAPCVHKQARTLRWIARLFLPDLFEVIQFYRTSSKRPAAASAVLCPRQPRRPRRPSTKPAPHAPGRRLRFIAAHAYRR